MNEVERSAEEAMDRLMRSMESHLGKDPRDVDREAADSYKTQARDERIASALPGRLRELEQRLMRHMSDNVIDQRLATRREAQGITEAAALRLPAQVDKDRVGERLRFARELLADKSGSKSVKRDVDTLALGVEWNRHVDGLNLSFRERVRYEAEAEGRQLTETGLSQEEATRNAHKLWSEGIRGPSFTEIDRYIELAQKNGTWPPRELHTGPGSIPRPHPQIYTFKQFQQYCADPVHQHNATSALAGEAALSEANGHESPALPVPRRQGLRGRLMNILRPISQRVVDRISRIGSGNREFTPPGLPAAAVHAQSNEYRVDVITSPHQQAMSTRHPVEYPAYYRPVMTNDISPTRRTEHSGASERAFMIAGRAAEPKSGYSR